jgi:hypothetical protein
MAQSTTKVIWQCLCHWSVRTFRTRGSNKMGRPVHFALPVWEYQNEMFPDRLNTFICANGVARKKARTLIKRKVTKKIHEDQQKLHKMHLCRLITQCCVACHIRTGKTLFLLRKRRRENVDRIKLSQLKMCSNWPGDECELFFSLI